MANCGRGEGWVELCRGRVGGTVQGVWVGGGAGPLTGSDVSRPMARRELLELVVDLIAARDQKRCATHKRAHTERVGEVGVRWGSSGEGSSGEGAASDQQRCATHAHTKKGVGRGRVGVRAADGAE
eukprot:3539033-Prymnesium_polylepis.1